MTSTGDANLTGIPNLHKKRVDRLLEAMRFAKAKPYIFKGAYLLDIGTGDGSFLHKLGGYISYAVGIDPVLTTLVEFCSYQLVPGYFPQDFAYDGTFDVITLLATVEHIPNAMLSDVADACWKYLRPRGKVIITVPHPFVDRILGVLKFFKIINGLALEEHYGFNPKKLPCVFKRWTMLKKERWQLGCNYLFVFEKS